MRELSKKIASTTLAGLALLPFGSCNEKTTPDNQQDPAKVQQYDPQCSDEITLSSPLYNPNIPELPHNHREEFLNPEHIEIVYWGDSSLSEDNRQLAKSQVLKSISLALEIDPNLGEAFKRPIQPTIVITSCVEDAYTRLTGNDASTLQEGTHAVTLSKHRLDVYLDRYLDGELEEDPDIYREDIVLIDLSRISPYASPDSPEVITIATVAHELYHLNQPQGQTENEKEIDATNKNIALLKKYAAMHPELSEACEANIKEEQEYQERFL